MLLGSLSLFSTLYAYARLACDRASSSALAPRAWTLTRGAPPQASNFQNLGTALLNLGNTEGGTVEAVQLYLHALACFRLALAELGGGDGSAEVVENIEAVEGNCRQRYNWRCEDMPEAAMQASALAEKGRLAHVGALLAPHMAATAPVGASTSAARKTARGRKDGSKKSVAPMEDKKAAVPMDEDDDDEDEGDEDEEDGEDEEDEEDEVMVGKDRAGPVGKPAHQSATKQQKTPAKATPGTNAGSAAKRWPMASPRGGAYVFSCLACVHARVRRVRTRGLSTTGAARPAGVC
jgi:hypothetical protein